jgi:acetyltransferase-like isoleucine patch superfamily enzyme
MSRLLAILNWIVRVVLKFRIDVEVGSGTSVRWWNLGARRGVLRIGSQSIVRCRVDFDSPQGEVVIGDRCYLGASHLVCHTGIKIGNDVIMSWGVTVVDHNSHAIEWPQRQHDVSDWMRGEKRWDAVAISPVHIGDRVWIGFGASILKGVNVGSGAVIGAQSVVTRDVPPNTVVAGNPARVVRELNGINERT